MFTEIIMLIVLVLLLLTANIKVVYAVGAVVLVYNLFVIRPNKKRYTKQITETECMFGVGKELSDCTYDYKSCLPKDTLERDRLVCPRQWDVEAVCRHSVKGEYSGAKVEISEASFGLRYGISRGETAFISGTYIEVTLPKSSGLDVCIFSKDIKHISDDAPDLSVYGLSPASLRSKKANDALLAYTADENVPEWLEKHFLKLCSHGAKTMMNLQGDRLSLMAVSRFYAAKHRLSDPVSMQTVCFDRLPEKADALELIRIIQRNAAL